MWRIHRYYLKELIANALVTFVVLFGIVLVSSIHRGISEAEGFNLLAAAKVTLLLTIDTLPHLLPISLLFSTVLTYARASQDREITAIRSAGISPRVAMTPALLLGIAITLIGSWLHHWEIPAVHYAKYRVVAETISKMITSTGMLGDKITIKDNLVMTWERARGRGRWEDVQILIRQSRAEWSLEQGLYLVDEATVEVIDDELLSLVLRNIRDVTRQNQIEGELRLTIDLHAIAAGARRTEGNSDLASDELISEVYRGVHSNPIAAWYTVHRRSCFAIMPCLLAPIGFCIGMMSRGRGRILALVFAMMPVFLFYLGDFVGNKLVRATDEPVFAWTPAVLLLVLGVPFCWRLLRY